MTEQRKKFERRLIIPSKYLIERILHDTELPSDYKVYVTVRDGRTEAVYTVTVRELADLVKSAQVYQTSVARFSQSHGAIWLDLARKGACRIPDDLLPGRRNGDILTRSQTQEIYDWCMGYTDTEGR